MRVQDAFHDRVRRREPAVGNHTPDRRRKFQRGRQQNGRCAHGEPAKKQRMIRAKVHGRVLRPCYDVPALMDAEGDIYALRLAVRAFVNGEQIISE